MNEKYQELGNVLKAHTQTVTEPSDRQDQFAFAAFLRAAIDESPLTRMQIAEASDLTEVELYALERGLFPTDKIDAQTFHRLADVLSIDSAIIGVLLNRDELITNMLNQSPDEFIHPMTGTHLTEFGPQAAIQNQVRFSMQQNQSPATAANVEQNAQPTRFRFFKAIQRYPASLLVGAAAALLLITLLNFQPSLLNNLVGESMTGASTGGATSATTLALPAATASSQGANLSLQPTAIMSNDGNNAGTNTLSSSSGEVMPTPLSRTVAQLRATAQALSASRSTDSITQEKAESEAISLAQSTMGNNNDNSDDSMAVQAVPIAATPRPSEFAIIADTGSNQAAAAAPEPADAPVAVAAAMAEEAAAEEVVEVSAAVVEYAAESAIIAAAEPAASVPAAPPPALAAEQKTELGIIVQSDRSQDGLRLDDYPAPAYPSAPRAMTFRDYGIHTFIETVMDNLSTFGVDVDTGSYTIARDYINKGLLPPPEAIRVEEFINYFDYGYAMPEQEEVFAIHMDAFPSPFIEERLGSAAAANVQLMRIGIQGYEIPDAQRPDVALTFVIDVSGSMEEDGRLTLVQRALTMLVEQLQPADSVGIVVYSTDARVLLPTTKAEQKNTILNAIYSLQPEDSTNVAAGLRMGYEMAWRNFDEQAVNRVILASDGVANVEATDPTHMWQQVSQYADLGITLTTIGVGMGNYNDVIMEQMADMGDGVYGYVDTIEEAERLFVDELTGTLIPIAKDAKVQVEFNPEVVSRYRLIGYENRDIADSDFRNNTVDAGEIGAGHSVTALYEVQLKGSGAAATVHFRWEDMASREVSEISKTLEVSTDGIAFADAPGGFQLAAVVTAFGEELRNGLFVDSQFRERIMPLNLEEAKALSQNIAETEEAVELFGLIERVEQMVMP